jgi:protein O-mannosyl-transferase
MREHLRPRILGLALFITVVMVFGRLCVSEFTWYDDPGTVHHNPSLNPPTLQKVGLYWTSFGRHAPLGLYIPLTYTVWSGLAKVSYIDRPDEAGIHLNPWVFHSANVVIHALAAVVVFALLRLLVRNDWAALVGALVFAVHPVQVEAVGWVSGLKDVLCGMLSLVALWQYVLYAQARVEHLAPEAVAPGSIRNGAAPDSGAVPPQLHYALATVAMLAAMLSKPAAVVVPVMAVCIDVLVLRRAARAALRGLLPWFVLVIPCILWTKAAQAATDVSVAPLWVRPMIALDCLAFYLWKLVVPIGLAVDYGRTPVRVFERGWWHVTWIVPVLVAVVVALSRKRRAELIASGALFIAGVLPVLGFTPFLFQHFSGVADHYLYLSMLGVALAAAVGVSSCPNKLTAGVCAAGLVTLAVLTVRQTGVWHDDLTLWAQNIKVNRDSGLAQLNLGAAHFRAGDMRQAEHHFREAIRIDSNDAAAHDNLAMVLITTGRRDEAVGHVQRVLEINEQLTPERKAQLESARQRLGHGQKAPGAQ